MKCYAYVEYFRNSVYSVLQDIAVHFIPNLSIWILRSQYGIYKADRNATLVATHLSVISCWLTLKMCFNMQTMTFYFDSCRKQGGWIWLSIVAWNEFHAYKIDGNPEVYSGNLTYDICRWVAQYVTDYERILAFK